MINKSTYYKVSAIYRRNAYEYIDGDFVRVDWVRWVVPNKEVGMIIECA